MAKLGVVAGAVLVATVAGVALTCTSSAEPPNTPEAGVADAPEEATDACQVRFDAPAPKLEALPEEAPPRSVISLGVDIPTKRIATELDKTVPRGLASAKRKPVGSAGEVTYNVTRGGFAFALKKDRLVVTTPISVAVSICKPLGPLCPTYGRCSPKLSATASVPLMVGSDYELRKPSISYGIAEGCSIAGTDQTSRIRGIADKQIGAVRAQIDKSVPKIKPHAERVLGEITKPRSVEGGGCVRVVPDTLEQARPKLEKGMLSLRAVARGVIDLSSAACAPAKEAKLPKLDELSADATPPTESELAAALTVTWEELTQALTSTLVGESVDESKITAVRLRAGTKDGKRVVLIGVTLDGRACGETWLSAELEADTELRFKPIEGASVAGLDELVEKVRIPIPATLIAAQTSLEELTKLQMPEDVPVKLSVALEPAKLSALPHAPGVQITARRRGTITAGFRR